MAAPRERASEATMRHRKGHLCRFGASHKMYAMISPRTGGGLPFQGKGSLVARRVKTKTTEQGPVDKSASATIVDFDALPIGEKLLFVAVETFTQGIASGVMGGLAGLVYGAFSRRTFEGARAEGRKFLVTWGLFGGVYSLGLGMARTVRQRQDKYNAVIAACASGAVFGREQGIQGMLSGCAQFAGFTYLIETFLIGAQSPQSQQDLGMGPRKIEIPVEERR